MEAPLIWPMLFLVAAVQGLFLSFMIFLRKSKANNLLGLLILAFSFCLLFYVAYWTEILNDLPRWVGVLQGLTYLFGPLLYCYIKSNKKGAYFNIWHFAPFALYVIYFFNWFQYPVDLRQTIRTTQVILQITHLVVYTGLIFHYTLKNKSAYNGAYKLYQWRKKLGLAFAGYTASFLLYFILVWTNTLKIEYDYMVSFASSFFIYFIGYHGFRHQEVFKMYENGRYEKSALAPTASKAILKSLLSYMESDKPYLDSTLKLQTLADQMGISQHHISQVINELEDKNFADFVNEYRIEEAKKLLLEPANQKIIHIAYDSGFNNKASFNNAFKKFTGLSPRQYRESHSIPA